MNEEQLFTAPSKGNTVFKEVRLDLKHRTRVVFGANIKKKQLTHLYIHNIHKLEPIQAGLDADLWESRHKIGRDSSLEVKRRK